MSNLHDCCYLKVRGKGTVAVRDTNVIVSEHALFRHVFPSNTN